MAINVNTTGIFPLAESDVTETGFQVISSGSQSIDGGTSGGFFVPAKDLNNYATNTEMNNDYRYFAYALMKCLDDHYGSLPAEDKPLNFTWTENNVKSTAGGKLYKDFTVRFWYQGEPPELGSSS
jgi:hypothetical protein